MPVRRSGVAGSQKYAPQVVVLNRDNASGLEDAPHVSQRSERILHVLQQIVGEGGVKRRVREGDRVDVSRLEAHVGNATLCGERSRVIELPLGNVDADHLAGRDNGGEIDGDRPGSAATIDEVHSRAQIR